MKRGNLEGNRRDFDWRRLLGSIIRLFGRFLSGLGICIFAIICDALLSSSRHLEFPHGALVFQHADVAQDGAESATLVVHLFPSVGDLEAQLVKSNGAMRLAMAALPPLFFTRHVPVVGKYEFRVAGREVWPAITWLGGVEDFMGLVGGLDGQENLQYVLSFQLEEDVVFGVGPRWLGRGERGGRRGNCRAGTHHNGCFDCFLRSFFL
mmetsp:Transcript_17986/g.36871  ORF Transcript_17986/g.36871 Transcript_17986/m.36871 type:complete len:208 (+) Transcript_17986:611-1234(+)